MILEEAGFVVKVNGVIVWILMISGG